MTQLNSCNGYGQRATLPQSKNDEKRGSSYPETEHSTAAAPYEGPSGLRAAPKTVELSLSIEFLQYPIRMLPNAFPVPYSWLLKGPIGFPCSQMPRTMKECELDVYLQHGYESPLIHWAPCTVL